MERDIAVYLDKATESLQTAESEFAAGRYNSCANRCYYACFQAGIAALLREGIRPHDRWTHDFVHGQFVGLLINRRKRYEPELRRTLADNQILRDQADYHAVRVTRTQAYRALMRCRTFVASVRQKGGVGQ
jgi:uncharacterized protein (UPF0332 family)